MLTVLIYYSTDPVPPMIASLLKELPTPTTPTVIEINSLPEAQEVRPKRRPATYICCRILF